MNKKFSTLVASLLLAGGVLSPAMADTLSGVEEGKYYQVHAAAKYDRGNKQWVAMETLRHLVGLDGKIANVADADAVWKVVKTDKGLYQLKNWKGEALTIAGASEFAFDEENVKVDETFYTQLKFGGATNEYVGLKNEKLVKRNVPGTPGEGVEDAIAIAFNPVAVNLQEVEKAGAYLLDDKKNSGKAIKLVYVNAEGEKVVDGTIYKLSYNEDNATWSLINNKTEKPLAIGNEVDFKVTNVGDDAVFGLPSGNKYVKYDGTRFTLVEGIGNATAFALQQTGWNSVTAEVLNVLEKDGFSVTIYHDSKDDNCFAEEHLATDIAGNPFTGHLTTMCWTGKKFVKVADCDNHGYHGRYFLKNADGKFIVAQQFEGQGSWKPEALYGFTTVSEEVLAEDLIRTANDGIDHTQKYFGEFSVNVDEADLDADPSLITKVTELTCLAVRVNEIDDEYSNWAEVGRYDFTTAGTPTLVASQYTDLKLIKISLGDREIVKWQDLVQNSFFTVEKITKNGQNNGKLATYQTVDGYAFVKSYGNVLEGQWALTLNDEKTCYIFTNRENPNIKFKGIDNVNGLYYVAGEENTYRFGGDTYVIKPVATTDADGYKRLDVKEDAAQMWNIAYSSNVFNGSAYLTENHDDSKTAVTHMIGLTTNNDDALQFSIKEYAAARKVEMGKDHEKVYTPTDTIYVISYLGTYNAKNNGYETVEDTLKVVSYSFVNQWNEPMVLSGLGNEDNAYVSLVTYKEGDKTYKYADASLAFAHKAADRFAVRYDANSDSKFNLRRIDMGYWKSAKKESQAHGAKLMYQEFNSLFTMNNNERYGDLIKMYCGDTEKGVLDVVHLYDRTENDLFVIEKTDKAIYRRLVKEGLDTISIYRNENEKSLLYEKTTEIAKDQFVNFLGLENIADFTKMEPAMLADTAYVRYETYKPQYMLVVDPTIHPEGKWCEEHQSATCEHAVPVKGWTEGRYLVNLVDSAKAWDEAHKHQAGNPYKNVEGFYKLGFVQATHRNDSLIIASDGKKTFIGNNDNQNGKYAFKYVDTEEKSFVIETTLDGTKTPGYLKWMNGVVVAVDDIKYADVYNMNEDELRNPTANEEVAVSEVSVVAVDGAVVVKGAAGKTVAISNILGQTIANTVIASDNETIAVPAGIVVVAVEGEEAVKAIVK